MSARRPPLEFRPITADDIEQWQRIASFSYERGAPVTVTPEHFGQPDRYRIGAYDGGKLRACLGINDYQMFFGRDRRPCGGVAGVMSEPASRGRGYAGGLMRRSLEVMREDGKYLSSLWPFSFAYYRQFGWEWTGFNRYYKLPIRALWSDKEADYMEPLYEPQADLLNPLYEAQATRYNGPLVRSPGRWPAHLRARDGREPMVYLYRRDGAPEGYAILRFIKNSDTLRVEDFVALSRRAYLGMLGLVHRHEMQGQDVELQVPPDDPLWSFIRSYDVETKEVSAGMARVVDVTAALQELEPPAEVRGAAVFALQDETAPWNSGTWRVTAEDGMVTLAPCRDEPGIALDIQALTQAYWGTPSLETLRAWERISVSREADFQLLHALLPSRLVWLADDF